MIPKADEVLEKLKGLIQEKLEVYFNEKILPSLLDKGYFDLTLIGLEGVEEFLFGYHRTEVIGKLESRGYCMIS